MAPGKPPLQWPWVSRGVPEEGIRQVQAMRVPVKGPGASGGDNNGSLLERAISAVLAGYSGASASLFGSAGELRPWVRTQSWYSLVAENQHQGVPTAW